MSLICDGGRMAQALHPANKRERRNRNEKWMSADVFNLIFLEDANVKKLLGTLMVLVLSCAAGEASAKTFHLGELPAGLTFVGGGPNAGGFADTFNFRLSSLSDVMVAFTASTGISSLQGILQEHTSGGWSQVGSGFATSSSFADLAAGRYRFDAIGFVPKNFGAYSASINVAAVPEASTWMMLLIGSGMVAFQLRRKQKSLPRQAIAPLA